MTVTTPTVWYANYGNGSSTGYFAVTAWHQPWTPTVGTITRQTAPTNANERCFVCIVSGAVNATEPAWSVTKGVKTIDNAATWMECTGNPALNGDVTAAPLSSQNRSGSQALGNIITNNAQTHYFICTTAGATGAGEPTYASTTGATTVDSSCTWTCLGTVGTFTGWMAPFSRLANMNSYAPASSTIYVSSIHAETQAAGLTLSLGGGTMPPLKIICVNNSTVPPTNATITTGATVTTTGNNALTVQGLAMDITGIAFSCGTSTANSALTVGNWSGGLWGMVRLHNCALATPSSGAAAIVFSGGVEMINTTVTFGNSANQGLSMAMSTLIWRDTPNALAATTWPTTLFLSGSTDYVSAVLIESVDLSAFAGSYFRSSSPIYGQRCVFSHCKFHATWTLVQGNDYFKPINVIDVINCDSGGATYNTQRAGYGGQQFMSTTAIAASGASDGTTSYSWRLTMPSNSTVAWAWPYESIPISIWNATTGANVTVTLQGAYVGTALPFNDDIWVDVLYFGTAGSTLSTRATGTKTNALTTHTQYSASSTLWGSAAPARQNAQAYVVGDVIGVSSDSSIVRAFYCTSAGTSAGSLPGGYATAVDGTQVTDSGAVFTAVERFSMAVTLSTPQPQAAGYLICYIRVATPNTTFFIDPLPVLT